MSADSSGKRTAREAKCLIVNISGTASKILRRSLFLRRLPGGTVRQGKHCGTTLVDMLSKFVRSERRV